MAGTIILPRQVAQEAGHRAFLVDLYPQPGQKGLARDGFQFSENGAGRDNPFPQQCFRQCLDRHERLEPHDRRRNELGSER
jgi:hypothetical protein